MILSTRKGADRNRLTALPEPSFCDRLRFHPPTFNRCNSAVFAICALVAASLVSAPNEPALLRRQPPCPARPPRDRIREPYLPCPAVQYQALQSFVMKTTLPRKIISPKLPGVLPQRVVEAKKPKPRLDEIRKKITLPQQELIDEVWQHFHQTGEWPILREMYSKRDEPTVRNALSELGGSVGSEGDSRRRWKTYRLSLIGVLLTKNGTSYQLLLVSYFDYQRTIFKKEPTKDYSTAAEVAAALELNAEQTALLGQLLSLGNLGGSENPKSDWGASAMEEAVKFPPEGDLSQQFEQWLLRFYSPQVAAFDDQRNFRGSSQWNFGDELASLSSLGEPTRTAEIVTPKTSHRPNTAFIMMWMDKSNPELTDVANAIKDVCGEFDIEAVRADDIEHADRITDVILQHIRDSEFLIADLTGERPNVYYEIGYAHALDKRPILYCKEGTRLHFDLSVHNVPAYSNLTELKKLLRIRFEAILSRKPKPVRK